MWALKTQGVGCCATESKRTAHGIGAGKSERNCVSTTINRFDDISRPVQYSAVLMARCLERGWTKRENWKDSPFQILKRFDDHDKT